MILNKKFQAAALLATTIAIAPAAFGQVEVYQLKGDIYGNLDGLVSDVGNMPYGYSIPSSSQGYAPVSLGSMTDTIFLDPGNLTVRQVATFSSPNNTTITLNESHTVAGQNVAGTLTVTQGLLGGGLTIDSGTQPVVWNGSTHTYSYPNLSIVASVALNSLAIGGSYSLVTGGQTYTGNFSYNLQPSMGSSSEPTLFTTFTQAPGQPSVVLGGATDFDGTVSGGQFVSMTAANGFQTSLIAGDSDDRLQNFNYGGSDLAASFVIPEPSAYALFGLGLTGLIAMRRGRFSFPRR